MDSLTVMMNLPSWGEEGRKLPNSHSPYHSNLPPSSFSYHIQESFTKAATRDGESSRMERGEGDQHSAAAVIVKEGATMIKSAWLCKQEQTSSFHLIKNIQTVSGLIRVKE